MYVLGLFVIDYDEFKLRDFLEELFKWEFEQLMIGQEKFIDVIRSCELLNLLGCY